MARADICDSQFIQDYMIENVDSWYDFALKCGFGPKQIPEGSIVFIRGCDKAPSFALAAFWKHKKEASISFQGGFVKSGDIRLSLEGSWEKTDAAEYRRGLPKNPELSSQIPSDEHGRLQFPFFAPDCVYTLFTRVYKIKRSRKKLGLRVPSKIVAAAGPHQLPRNDDDDDPGAAGSSASPDDCQDNLEDDTCTVIMNQSTNAV
jgi:hypothetical protein